jgi:CDP-paratose 2-epimerase
MRILVTGGAGFVGSNLAIALNERHPDWRLIAADNLFRRGSELNLPRLQAAGVEFVHADIRQAGDLERIGRCDAIIDAAAEPAVGADRREGGRRLLIETNLMGTANCLELAAASDAHFLMLSTSRVYPIDALEGLSYERGETRFVLTDAQAQSGASGSGISEAFTLEGPRSLYGSTKLAAEMLAGEYGDSLGLPITVNRCGVIAGPWQMGTSEQGVFTHWALSFVEKRPLSYIGYGGDGRQVRDLLHIDDLTDLVELQVSDPAGWAGVTVNVGGGLEGSLSLLETTAICAELTGNELELGSIAETRPGDVPIYISDCSKLQGMCDWRPRRGPRETLADTIAWLQSNRQVLETI